MSLIAAQNALLAEREKLMQELGMDASRREQESIVEALSSEQRAARAKTNAMDMWLKMIAVAQTAVAAERAAARAARRPGGKLTNALSEAAYPVSPLAKMSQVAASAIAASSGSSASKKNGGFFASLFKW